MKNFNEVEKKWHIVSATSLRGLLKRALEENCQLSADDKYGNTSIFDRKKVTMTQLIRMKNERLIRDYSVGISSDGIYLQANIELLDGSMLTCEREITFKL